MAEVAVSQHRAMPKMGDLEYEDIPEGNSTVWIGFMDIIPVIGSVKESVEFVLAVYEGDDKVIKEKQKALEIFVTEHVRQETKIQSKQEADAAEFSGLLNVTEVANWNIVEYVMKGSKKKTQQIKISADEKKARAEKLEKIKKEMIEILKSIDEPFKGELTEELKRSKRGEHVFNNDILKFHSKVLEDFRKKYNIESLRKYHKQTMDRFDRHTLSTKTEREIQDNMVVHFDPEEFYVNTNAILYGAFSKVLRDAFLNLKLMSHISPRNEKQDVNNIISNMNNYELYVDKFAKEKWIGNNSNKQKRFNDVKKEVAQMYSADRGLNWYIDMLRAVAPWFDNSQ